MKKIIKILSIILTLSIFIGVFSTATPVWAAEIENAIVEKEIKSSFEDNMNENKTAQISDDVYIIGEDESRRDENTKHFIMSDGTRKAAIYSEPVHYRVNGKWTDIDNRLEYNKEEKEYRNRQNSFDVKFKENFEDGDFFSIENKGYTLSWEYSKNLVSKIFVNTEVYEANELENYSYKQIHKPNGKIKYLNFENNCELEYVVTSTGVKENIILNQKTNKNEFEFNVSAEGLILEKNNDGSISAKTKDSEEIFYIPAPFMYDAEGVYSAKVSYELKERTTGEYKITVIADKDWLQSDERSYPIIIDPVINTKRNRSDIDSTFIASDTPNTNYYETSHLSIGWESYEYGHTRTLIKFTLPELNKGDMVVGASLNLVTWNESAYTSTTPEQQIDAHLIQNSWSEESITWSNKPTASSVILDYDFLDADGVSEWHQFDITRAVKGWHEGEFANYGIMLKQNVENGTYAEDCANAWYWTEKYNNEYDYYPVIEIDYRNNKGIEGYWSYTSFSAGGSVGSINDYTGNLVYQIPLASSVSEIMPVSLCLVYNTYSAGQKYVAGKNNSNLTSCSKGWKLNIQETVISSTKYGLSGEDAERYPYVYTDSDGTEHYFKKITKTDNDGNEVITYEDEDNLGLTLDDVATSTYTYKITDKQDNVWLFNAKGNLGIMKDSNGNQIKITYDTNKTKIQSVTDGTGHTFDFTYYTPEGGEETDYLYTITDNGGRTTKLHFPNGYLDTVTYCDGSKISIVYEDEDNIGNASFEGLINYVMSSDGNGVNFNYTTKATGRRVSKATELGISTTDSTTIIGGQVVTFDRTRYNTTIIRTPGIDGIHTTENEANGNDDIVTMLQFNDMGSPVSQQVSYGNGSAVGAGAYNYGSKNDSSKNKITDAASLGKNVVNLLKNSNAENLDNWTHATSGTLATSKAVSSTEQYTGKGSLVINNTSISTNGANSFLRQIINGSYTANTNYTFSTFVKTVGLSKTDDTGYNGAYIQISAYDSNGINLGTVKSQLLDSETEPAVNNGWRRLSATLKTPAGTTMITVYLCLRNATGKAYFDCMQLEKGAIPNSVNLLENSSFENGTSGIPDNWTATGNTDTAIDKITTAAKKNGSNSIILFGGADESKGYYQTVPVSGNENDTYIVSGWAAAFGINPTFHSHYEKNGVRITDETASEILTNTNKEDDKQLEVIEDSKFEIAVRVTYKKTDASGNISTVTQFKEPAKYNTTVTKWQYAATPICLKYTDGESGCTYIPTHILVMPRFNKQENYAYFDHIQLIKDVAQSYIYDDEGNLVSVSANAEQKNNMTYDGEDNLIEYKDAIGCTTTFNYATGTHNLTSITSPKGVTTAYTYNNKGQSTASETRNSGNTRKIKTGISYTVASGDISAGAYVSSVSDEHGYKTTYTYDMETGAPLTITSPNGTVTTNSYTDNKYCKLSSVSGGNSKVSYTYKGNRVESILFGTGSVSEKYSFKYDAYGNVLSTSVGGVVLSTNVYQENNGVLLQSLYNNGDGIKYSYNYSGNKTAEFRKTGTDETAANFSSNASYKWSYSVDGTPRTHTDNENKLKYTYSYDSIGRLIRQDITNSENDLVVGFTEFGYNSRGHQTSLKNEIGGRIHAQYYSYSKITDDNGNVINDSLNNGKDGLPTRYKIASNRYADYSYDSLNRLNLRAFSTTRPLYNNYLYNYSARDTGDGTYRTNQLGIEIVDNTAYRYTYDKVGNITKIEKGERTTKDSSQTAAEKYTMVCSYVYDSLGQLVRENNVEDNKTYVWNYDSLGNIESLLVYDYTTGAVSNPESGIDYQYTNDNKEGWNKLLTTLVYKEYIYNEAHPNGTPDVISTETVNYDKIGNPTNYQGATMSWFGRQMTSYSKVAVTATFTYDADGLRGSKTVNGAKTTYYYVGNKLYYQRTANADGSTNYELYFYYDSYNNLSAIRYINSSGDYYYYVTTNAQGDVLGLYDGDGALHVSYEYDAWGNATVYTVTQNSAGENVYTKTTNLNSIAHRNPIRYRGYYYDNDLGLYYLQSRYYDSTIGRFINADGYITTDISDPLSYNMFAYCKNNPIIHIDASGSSLKDVWEWIVEQCERSFNIQQQNQAIDNRIRHQQIDSARNVVEASWDAYVSSNKLQAENKYEQDIAIKTGIEKEIGRWRDDPELAGDFFFMASGNVVVYVSLASLAATCPGIGAICELVYAVLSAIWTTYRYFHTDE